MVARKTTQKDSGKLAAHPLKVLPAPGTEFSAVGVGASAGGLEATLREALAMLQGRCNGQDTQLHQARALEGILRQAQEVLEQRMAHLETAQPRRGGGEPPKGRK